jgi:hypothetical protein
VADVFHEWPQVFNLRNNSGRRFSTCGTTSEPLHVQVENLHPLSQLKTCTHFLSRKPAPTFPAENLHPRHTGAARSAGHAIREDRL